MRKKWDVAQGNDCTSFGVGMCSVLISTLLSPPKDRSRKLHLFLFMDSESGGSEYMLFTFSYPVENANVPRQIKLITIKQSRGWILSLFPMLFLFYEGRGGSRDKIIDEPILRHQSHFSWESFRFHRSMFSSLHQPNHSLSHSKVLKGSSIPSEVPEFLTQAVQPNKGEAFTWAELTLFN